MIAMALSCNPQLLIADEPTTALDVTIQAQILEILRKLRDNRGMAIIFITHDLGVIAEIADEVLVMYRGEEVEYGPVLEIFANPKHPYTKGLLACRPRLETRYRRLPTVDDFMETVRERSTAQSASSKRRWTPRGSSISKPPAAAGCCIPKPNSPAIGHPWEEGHHAPDTQTVAEGTAPLLAVKNLQVYFPVRRGILARTVDHIRAVDDISFNVYRGQTLGLVGESRLRQNDHRPRHPAPHRAHRRQRPLQRHRPRPTQRARAPRTCAAKCRSSFRTRTARSTRG